jgi:hypothetical protein
MLIFMTYISPQWFSMFSVCIKVLIRWSTVAEYELTPENKTAGALPSMSHIKSRKQSAHKVCHLSVNKLVNI